VMKMVKVRVVAEVEVREKIPLILQRSQLRKKVPVLWHNVTSKLKLCLKMEKAVKHVVQVWQSMGEAENVWKTLANKTNFSIKMMHVRNVILLI